MSFQLHPTLAGDSFVLGRFELCLLLLINDRQYPWFVLVPQRSDISEIYQLSELEQQLLWSESDLLSKIIMDFYKGDKLNIAALGNMVPQLHVHHIVRFKDDICWPKPVWGQMPMQAYKSEEIDKIRASLAEILIKTNFRQC